MRAELRVQGKFLTQSGLPAKLQPEFLMATIQLVALRRPAAIPELERAVRDRRVNAVARRVVSGARVGAVIARLPVLRWNFLIRRPMPCHQVARPGLICNGIMKSQLDYAFDK
jgi:hypothetical protein